MKKLNEIFNKLFEETVGQVGAGFVNRTILGGSGEPVQVSVPRISGLHTFRAGILPSLGLADESAFGGDIALFNEWAARLYGTSANPVIAEFIGKLVRLRQTEPWRATLLRVIITKHPHEAAQRQILVFLANSSGYDDFYNRVCMLVPEKQLSTKAGEWLRRNVLNWGAVKKHARSGRDFTVRHARRGDSYVARTAVPPVRAKRVAWNASLDRTARRIEQNGGRLSTKWWLPF
ncbi:MAG: hypothetical protein HYT31_02920 [Parcubacteria group bacterium]|nr:hypothetical protein [Parcubacteria group bacterium]